MCNRPSIGVLLLILGGSLVVLIVIPIGGILLDRYTDIDVGALLLYLTAIGALAAAGAAGIQVRETRKAVGAAFQANALAETTHQRQVRPYITVEDLRWRGGYHEAHIKNHGGGVAVAIRYELALLEIPSTGSIEAPTFEDWKSLALRPVEVAEDPESALGAGAERWVGFASEQELSALGLRDLMAYWKFSYDTLYGVRESNETGPQAFMVGPPTVLAPSARSVNGQKRLTLKLQNRRSLLLANVELQIVAIERWGPTSGWTPTGSNLPAPLQWLPSASNVGRLVPGGLLEADVAVYDPQSPLIDVAGDHLAGGVYKIHLVALAAEQDPRHDQFCFQWSPGGGISNSTLPGDARLAWVNEPGA